MHVPRVRPPAAIAACAIILMAAVARAEFETAASSSPSPQDPFSILPYHGSVRLTFGHDNNLLLVPDAPPFHTGEQDGTFAVLDLTGGITLPVSDRVSFGAELSGSMVRTFGTQPAGTPDFVTDPQDYSRHVIEPKVFATFSLGNLTLSPSLAYRIEGGSDVHAVGSQSTILRLDAGYDLSDTTSLSAWAFQARTAFDVEFPGQPTRTRDGDFTEAEISIRHAFADFRRAVSFGIAVERNDAEGRDWQFEGTRVFGGIESHLGGRFFGGLSASYTDRTYEASFDDIVPGGRTSQQITDLGLQISYVFDIDRQIEFNATHSAFSGNDPAFSGDRTVVGISFVVTFP